MTQAAGDLSGQVIASQFSVIKKLGAGGMGAVYLAEQIDMGRKVVVKVMHPELTAGSPTAAERFKREARSVAQLNHPNIVQVYVFGQTDTGQMYLAMEFIDGRDLTTELQRGRMHPARALRILDQVAHALVEAHSANIVHRDLKPDNIMLTDRHGNPDYVKVLDFGIAKMIGDEHGQATLTQAGAVFGTPRYMAPEQCKGETVDARTDIYALGVILYEMLTSEHPFQANSAMDYLIKHTTEDVVPPQQRFTGLDLPPPVEAILMKCVAKEPANRFQSAAELQRAIREALRTFPDGARHAPTPGAAVPPMSYPTERATSSGGGSKTWLWVLLALLIVGGGVTAAVLASGGGGGDSTALASTDGDDTADEETDEKKADEKKTEDKADEKKTEDKADEKKTDEKKTEDKADEKAVEDKADEKVEDKADEKVEDKADEKVEEKTDEKVEETPPEPAKPSLEAGDPIDGFPMPAGMTKSMSSAQALIYNTDHKAKDLVDFWKYHLTDKYGSFKLIPNGIQVDSSDSPFSFVTLQNAPSGLMVVLSRNVMFEKEATGTETSDAFGVAVMPGASEMVRTAEVVTLQTSKPAKEVFDYYAGLYGELKGITLYRNDTNDPPVLSIANTSNTEVQWKAISVVANTSQPGTMLISVMKR